MDGKNVYELIEELNYEHITSREYLLTRRFHLWWSSLKKFHPTMLYRHIRNIWYKFIRPSNNLLLNVSSHDASLGKTVVYACIAGPYDLPREPFLPEPDVDYILYTDQPKTQEETVWQYRDIPEKVLEISTNGRIRNTYIKTHPKEFFPDYDFAIYVDGNMRIMSNLSSWTTLVSPKAGMAVHKLAAEMCVYEHGKDMVAWGRGDAKGIRSQLAHYRNQGLPKNAGVLENTAIVTDLRSPIASEIYNLWWEEFYSWNSLRDQLSLPYVLWKLGISVNDIGTLGEHVWSNPKLRRYAHVMTSNYVDKVEK